MSDPLVSVLMTSYNREKYIAGAIESLLASTYTNFELIIVDDCSTDNTVSIVRSYQDKDNRIKVHVNEKNIGQFPNRNFAAGLARGKYIKYLDSDDLIYSHGLEILVEMMEKFPEAGYGLCSLDQDNENIFPFMLGPEAAYKRHFCKHIPLFHKAPLSSIIKKQAFLESGGFTNHGGEGDYELWLALSAKFSVVLMPQGIVWYRYHDEQIDFKRRSDPFERFRYFLVTLKYSGVDCPLPPELAKAVNKETHKSMVKFIIISFFRYSPRKAAQMYKSAGYRFGDFTKKCFIIITGKFLKRP